MSRRLALMTLLLPMWATLGLAEGSDDERGTDAVGVTRAPSTAASRSNPFAGDPSAIRAGHKLYLRHCAECHGDDARGRGKAPPLLSRRVQGAPPGDLYWFLTNGDLGAGMPSWSRLPDARRWQLVTFLKTLSTPSGP
ncbi:MAG TPA: c-type cytochrome [Vicinamibacteria bacterium]|jgi:mono/diheme cytochrome c family protein|nr:c-type cytochrome [Vicinamibacteria bacterium]